MLRTFLLKSVGAALILWASAVLATIGPPVQVRLVGEIPEFVPGQTRQVTIEVISTGDASLEYLSVAGIGWTVNVADLPQSKSMAAGDQILIEVNASTRNADEPLVIDMLVNDQPFRHEFDLSPEAVARSRGAVPGRADPQNPGAAVVAPPADADAKGGVNKAARNIRVYGKVWTTRPDGVIVTAPNCRIDIWEDDVEPNPNDFIVTGYADANGNFDITFFWDAISEAQPDLLFDFFFEDRNVRVQDANGSLYGYRSSTTWNYTGTFLNMGSWQPPSGYEPVGFLYSNLSRGKDILWLAGGASQSWDTPLVQCQWFPGSTNGPDYNSDLIRMSESQVWGEIVLHHEFGHHWHSSFSAISPFSYCNGTCDGSECGHCQWCNEDLGTAWNEGLANYLGELLTGSVAAVFGPAAFTGTGSIVTNFESIDANSSYCNAGYTPNPPINEGYVAALLRDITDTQNDNDPSISGGSDQLSLSWDEILRTIDSDNPVDIMDFLARFNARYNQHQSALVQTALNNGFSVSNSIANLTPFQPSGWAYPVLPRSTGDATSSTAPISPFLFGNVGATWLSVCITNSGGFPTVNPIEYLVSVDGTEKSNFNYESLWPGYWRYSGNRGP